MEVNNKNIRSMTLSGVQRLNLKKMCMQTGWAQFDPEVFAALIWRLDEPKTTQLTFTSANNVCTGAKSELDARIACRIHTAILQENGIECGMTMFVVQNIVASAYTGFPLRLEAIAIAYSPDATYDPEIFPGLIYRMKHPKIVFLVFREGKLVITGGKKRSELTKAADIFFNTILIPHRDHSTTINYVHAPLDTPLVDVIGEIVDGFGEQADAEEMSGYGEDVEDFSDMAKVNEKIDLYESYYERQQK